ncbi:MAG: hypothetical protein IPK25_16470, partial [Saprospiraceae bacterium]|nr:hypothetical protein [Saprospiraceae bacterium]
MLTFLVTTYSRIYLHREPGYKRFYTISFLFRVYAGYICGQSGNIVYWLG